MPYGINLKQRNRRLNFGNRYALDDIPGGVENNVLWLSYYQMTNRRNDECFRLRDLTTSDEWDIGRINGYVDYVRVLNLLGGHTGLATKIYNNTWAAGAQDAIQVDVANMPVVAEGGVFHHNGFKFVKASSNYMQITDYAGVQIIEPPFSFYVNYYNITSQSYSYVFSKRDVDIYQYELSINATTARPRILDSTALVLDNNETGNNKILGAWIGKGSNEFKCICNIATAEMTRNGTLTNTGSFYIGSRFSPAGFYDGNIKTIAISADNLYSYYNILAARC
jgi:hypothetical protein